MSGCIDDTETGDSGAAGDGGRESDDAGKATVTWKLFEFDRPTTDTDDTDSSDDGA